MGAGSAVSLNHKRICDGARQCEDMCEEIPLLKCGDVVVNTENKPACEVRNMGGFDECLPKKEVEPSDPSDAVGGYVALAVGVGALACGLLSWCCCHKPEEDDETDEKEIARQSSPDY